MVRFRASNLTRLAVKKYFSVYRASLKRFAEYRAEIAMDLSGKILLPTFVQSILWRAVIESTPDGQIAGYDYDAMFRYVVASLLVANVVKVDAIERQIANAIKDGTLNKFLAQPVDFGFYNLMTFLADSTPTIVGGALVYAAMLGSGFVSATAIQIVSGVAVLSCAALISFWLSFIIATLAFYMDEVWTLFVMKGMALWLLTGQIIPLDLFPESAQRILKWLPFGYLAFAPTKMLLGDYSTDEIAFSVWVVFSWTLGLYLLHKFFWSYALRQYSAFGG